MGGRLASNKRQRNTRCDNIGQSTYLSSLRIIHQPLAPYIALTKQLTLEARAKCGTLVDPPYGNGKVVTPLPFNELHEL